MRKPIRIYSSFEEQEKDEIAFTLSLTPEQRIATTVALIKRVHGYKDGPKKKVLKVNYCR